MKAASALHSMCVTVLAGLGETHQNEGWNGLVRPCTISPVAASEAGTLTGHGAMGGGILIHSGDLTCGLPVCREAGGSGAEAGEPTWQKGAHSPLHATRRQHHLPPSQHRTSGRLSSIGVPGTASP